MYNTLGILHQPLRIGFDGWRPLITSF